MSWYDTHPQIWHPHMSWYDTYMWSVISYVEHICGVSYLCGVSYQLICGWLICGAYMWSVISSCVNVELIAHTCSVELIAHMIDHTHEPCPLMCGAKKFFFSTKKKYGAHHAKKRGFWCGAYYTQKKRVIFGFFCWSHFFLSKKRHAQWAPHREWNICKGEGGGSFCYWFFVFIRVWFVLSSLESDLYPGVFVFVRI